MIFKNISIGRRLLIGFGILLLSAVLTGGVALFEINHIWKQSENLYEHPFAVSNAVRDVKISILNIRRYMLNIAFVKQAAEVDYYEAQIEAEEAKALQSFEVIKEYYLGNSGEVDQLYDMFIHWQELRNSSINNIRSETHDVSKSMMSKENLEYVTLLFEKSQTLIDFASAKADGFYRASKDSKERALRFVVSVLVIAFALSLGLAILISLSLRKPLLDVVDRIANVAQGILRDDSLPESRDEIGQLAASYNLLQQNLSHKTDVAIKISQGDFSERVVSKGEFDSVAEAINKIAENFEMVIGQAEQIALGNYRVNADRSVSENKLSIVVALMLDSLREVVDKANQIAEGDYSGEITPKSKYDELALALNQMTLSLREVTSQNARQTQLVTAQNEFYDNLRGEQSVEDLSKNIITFLTKKAQAQLGAIYIQNDDNAEYRLTASYAFKERKGVRDSFKMGEGMVGQVAMEKQIVCFSNLPDDYIYISSGLGEALPRHVILSPLVYNGITLGVIEMGALAEFTHDFRDFLLLVSENASISIATAKSRRQMAKLLQVTKEQAEELQVQQEELRQSNTELEAQTRALQKSEESLQAQQEELRVINEELEEKTRNLERQKSQIQGQNDELEKVSHEIQRKAKELEITSKYKSEFLANMSHELRTPLNSLLILSQSLVDNDNNNLTPDQIESAKIIHNSGKDLLQLINDILDLSKIEAGKVQLHTSQVKLTNVVQSLYESFTPLAAQKNLSLDIQCDKNAPVSLVTDEQRLNQILRNLVSNAIKFTDEGGVKVRFYTPDKVDALPFGFGLPNECIVVSVSDTGIGISPDKQQQIFEAFLQADGSISRRYGGTGLGLSITRELVHLLQGEIQLKSEPGVGSEFSIVLPLSIIAGKAAEKVDLPDEITKSDILEENSSVIKNVTHIYDDDRNNLTSDDKSILVIEDDPRFAKILIAYVQKKGLKCVATSTGEEGVDLARQYLPQGIILDINLPGMNGWQVLQILKKQASTRHIPVHIISGHEEDNEAYLKGAVGFLRKPASKSDLDEAITKIQMYSDKKIKELLVIEDDENLRKAVCNLLTSSDIQITECSNGKSAIDMLAEKEFDCAVLDLGLPDMTGFELLSELEKQHIAIPPIVVYTGRELSNDENSQLQQYTSNIIIKGVKSEERLLDETALFMHRMVNQMPERQKKMLISMYDKTKVFIDKKVLVVDDDMRNVFAITKVLEGAGMIVTMAANGEKALEKLNQTPDFNVVLMDIMMPVMDGYETIRQIRKLPQFAHLPIIALTAKAMKEDRQKTIEAGANDYLSKPVDVHKLFNLMQIWLYK